MNRARDSGPQVSVVMPVYNTERYLGQAIESVLAQTFGDFELVIVDDGSTDGSPAIAQRYAELDPRVRVVRNEHNLGIVQTRNRAFAEADPRSDYFAVLDGDDVCMPDRLARQVEFMQAHPDHALVGGDNLIIDEQGTVIGQRRYPSTHEQIIRVITRYNPISQPTVMIRRSALSEVGAYSERYPRCQDYELWLRMAARFKVANLPVFTLKYRISATQGKRVQLGESLRYTLQIQREWLFHRPFFAPYNVLYFCAEHALLLLPDALVLAAFKRLTYRRTVTAAMDATRERVAVLALSTIERDARVQRQIACLSADYEVVVIGYGGLGAAALPHVGMRPVPRAWPKPLHLGIVLACTTVGRALPRLGYTAWDAALRDHRAALDALVAAKPKIIVANDWNTLPIALRARQSTGAEVVADLHEYSPLHWGSRRTWMLLIAPMVDYHLRAAAPHLSAAMTVNQTIAERYAREYGIRCEVVRNIPTSEEQAAFRATDPERIRLVHHGFSTRERSLHLMIEIVARLDPRFSLHLLLIDSDPGYMAELRRLAATLAPGRVHFEQPVRANEIVGAISRYDIGIFVLPPTTFNYHAALPNKFFEFLFAGLAVCIGPSPEMARIAAEHECGVVAGSFDPAEVAARLNRLSAADIDAMKRRSLAARDSLRPERELDVLRGLMARVARAGGRAQAAR